MLTFRDLSLPSSWVRTSVRVLLLALSLVTSVPRMAVIDLPKLTQLLTRTAQEITARIP